MIASGSVAAGPSGSVRGSRRPPASPPWLSFSGRWPWVSRPRRSILPEKGLTPPRAPGAKATGMIPIDSYHEPRLES